MARIQVLTLPSRPGEAAPFILIIDGTRDWEAQAQDELAFGSFGTEFRDRIGAAAVLIVAERIDVVGAGA